MPDPSPNPRRTLQPLAPRRAPLLWKMLGVALAAHLVIILATSRSAFFADKDGPDQLFEKGEKAMAAGQYLEAMEHYRRVLDMAPKQPPVFEKAAEQHRNAEKQAKLKAAKVAAATQESPTAIPTPPASKPVADAPKVKVTPTASDADIPPELRPK